MHQDRGDRPKSSSNKGRERPTMSNMSRPRTAASHRSTSCSSRVRTSSPSGCQQPPELDISGVSTISRHDSTRKTMDGASRQAQLEKYKAEKEEQELLYDVLEAKALIAEAELTWAPPPDLLECQAKSKEVKKAISAATEEMEELLELHTKISMLLEAQAAVDQTQKHLEGVAVPSEELIKTLEDLVQLLKGAVLVENGVLLPQGDELERLKPRLERLFSEEEQIALDNAKKYAEAMARLAENVKAVEAADQKLSQLKKEKEMWERHCKSLQESLELYQIWHEEHRQNTNSV